jgi:uncharacterized protein YdeI (BOF family)
MAKPAFVLRRREAHRGNVRVKVRVDISGEFDKDMVGNKAEPDVKRLSLAR